MQTLVVALYTVLLEKAHKQEKKKKRKPVESLIRYFIIYKVSVEQKGHDEKLRTLNHDLHSSIVILNYLYP